MAEAKRCTGCEQVKPIDQYTHNGHGRRRSRCRACESKANAAYRAAHPKPPATFAIEEAARRKSELIEDVEWMLTGGESLWGAAQRLGMNPNTLERRLERYAKSGLIGALKANQYDPHDTFHH